jgi:hypothetical protein
MRSMNRVLLVCALLLVVVTGQLKFSSQLNLDRNFDWFAGGAYTAKGQWLSKFTYDIYSPLQSVDATLYVDPDNSIVSIQIAGYANQWITNTGFYATFPKFHGMCFYSDFNTSRYVRSYKEANCTNGGIIKNHYFGLVRDPAACDYYGATEIDTITYFLPKRERVHQYSYVLPSYIPMPVSIIAKYFGTFKSESVTDGVNYTATALPSECSPSVHNPMSYCGFFMPDTNNYTMYY